jgi:D-sorbitol dehydrogenase (acceptor)
MGSIRLSEVTKSFDEVNVIPPLDLEINDGEFVVFVGPSGCGKSTLLRLIAGLEDVTSGKITIDGQDATELAPAKRQLAMVFQSYALYPHMSVRKNIAFPMKMAAMPKDEQDRRIDNAARVLNLTDYLDRRPGQLSGGQRQRVAIGRAIVREPKAFLFDEPLSNLDAALRVNMRLEISELHQNLSTTMIYVTHDQVEAMTMADKIVVLNDGRIEQVGSPLELYSEPVNLFVAGRRSHDRCTARAPDAFVGRRALERNRRRSRTPWLRHLSVRRDGARRPSHGKGRGRSRSAPRRHRLRVCRSGEGLPVRRGRPGNPVTPRMGNRLHGKTALITGAARGIGRAFAKAYVQEGATVAIGDIDFPRAEASAAEIGTSAYAVHLDVTKQASIDRAVDEVLAKSGGIDILVNNAGVFDMAPVTEITTESYDRVFAINVKGTLFTLQVVAASMIARGKGGKIINMASQAGRRGEALVAVYCASKAAVISLTQSAGLNLIKHRINVNAIAPGVVDGEHWDGVDAMFAKYENRPLGEKKRLVGEAVPFGRMGTAEDLIGMAIFLASAESDYVVAQTFNVDGGNWMS